MHEVSSLSAFPLSSFVQVLPHEYFLPLVILLVLSLFMLSKTLLPLVKFSLSFLLLLLPRFSSLKFRKQWQVYINIAMFDSASSLSCRLMHDGKFRQLV